MRFQSGYIYIVKARNGYWYIVRQTAPKSWKALEFANLKIHTDDVFHYSNGAKLWAQIEPQEFKKFLDIKSEHGAYRKTLFTLLRYGTLEE